MFIFITKRGIGGGGRKVEGAEKRRKCSACAHGAVGVGKLEIVERMMR